MPCLAVLRHTDVMDVACAWAELGQVAALASLVAAYPTALGSGHALLRVLGRLPETLDPRLYAQLLPKVGTCGLVLCCAPLCLAVLHRPSLCAVLRHVFGMWLLLVAPRLACGMGLHTSVCAWSLAPPDAPPQLRL